MIRLKAPLVSFVLIALLALVGYQIYRLSQLKPEAQKTRRYYGERKPTHLQILKSDQPEFVETMEAIEGLRVYFQNPQNEPGGRGPGAELYRKHMEMLRRNAALALHEFEQIILNESEPLSLRIELMRLLASPRFREEATRYFLAARFVDPHEDPSLRLVALHELQSYPGEATFRQCRQVYDLEPEFPGRYQIVLAVGSTQCEEAIPFLKDCLKTDNPPDIRCHAAQSLGSFIDRPGVFEILKGLAYNDVNKEVRRNALIEIGKRAGPETDEVLKAVADRSSEDESVRKTAQALIRQRRAGDPK